MMKSAIADDDWTNLSDEWKAVPASIGIDALRDRVRAQGRRLRVFLVLEIALTLGAIIALALGARGARTWDAWVQLGGLALLTLVVWGFNLVNRRGTWRAAAETLEAYQALEVTRHRRRLAAATFTRRLCLVSLIPLGWLAWARYQQGGGDLTSVPVLVTAGAMVYLLVWALGAWWLERRIRG